MPEKWDDVRTKHAPRRFGYPARTPSRNQRLPGQHVNQSQSNPAEPRDRSEQTEVPHQRKPLVLKDQSANPLDARERTTSSMTSTSRQHRSAKSLDARHANQHHQSQHPRRRTGRDRREKRSRKKTRSGSRKLPIIASSVLGVITCVVGAILVLSGNSPVATTSGAQHRRSGGSSAGRSRDLEREDQTVLRNALLRLSRRQRW